MSLPITIEGQKYFVSFPSLADFRSFREFLARETRQKMGDAIPAGLPDDELKRRLRFVNEECEAIDPLSAMKQLLSTPDGSALYFYGWLRRDNPGATLDWVTSLISRCEESAPAALEGLRELRVAMQTLMEAKKNEIEAAKKAKDPEPPADPQPTSTPSTSS